MFSRATVILRTLSTVVLERFWISNKIQEKVITLPKKTFLVLPYLGPLSLQTRTKSGKSVKAILIFFKLQIVFKCQNKLTNTFRFKYFIPKELTSVVLYKFQCGLCNECMCKTP